MQVGQLIMYYTPKKVLPFAFFFNLQGHQKSGRNLFSDKSCWVICDWTHREDAKKIIFLMAWPLRPNPPPPLELNGRWNVEKKGSQKSYFFLNGQPFTYCLNILSSHKNDLLKEKNKMYRQSPCIPINEFVQRLFREPKITRSLITQQEFFWKWFLPGFWRPGKGRHT